MKIYIAGQVTDGGSLSDSKIEANCKRFDEVTFRLREQGHEPINPIALMPMHPVRMVKAQNGPQIAMRLCITALLSSDAIYLMQGWEHSTGGRLEQQIALAIGMRIMFESVSCDRCAAPLREGTLSTFCSTCGPTPLCPGCAELHRAEIAISNI